MQRGWEGEQTTHRPGTRELDICMPTQHLRSFTRRAAVSLVHRTSRVERNTAYSSHTEAMSDYGCSSRQRASMRIALALLCACGSAAFAQADGGADAGGRADAAVSNAPAEKPSGTFTLKETTKPVRRERQEDREARQRHRSEPNHHRTQTKFTEVFCSHPLLHAHASWRTNAVCQVSGTARSQARLEIHGSGRLQPPLLSCQSWQFQAISNMNASRAEKIRLKEELRRELQNKYVGTAVIGCNVRCT